MCQVGGDLWREEPSARNKNEHVCTLVPTFQNVAIWVNQKHIHSLDEHTSNLKSLDNICSNEEMVRKILRCLLKNKSVPKVIETKEAQNRKILHPKRLLGRLFFTWDLPQNIRGRHCYQNDIAIRTILHSTLQIKGLVLWEENQITKKMVVLMRKGVKKILSLKKLK